MADDLPHPIYWVPSILKITTDNYTRGFLLAVLRRAKDPRWQPTARQHAFLTRVVAEFFATCGDGPADDFEVIDDGG